MKKFTIALLVLCSLLLFAGSSKKHHKKHAANKNNEIVKIYNKGVSCAKSGNYEEANTYFKQAAEKGNANAQYNLGLNLLLGKGCTANQAEAVKWLKKAADQGHAKAKQALKELPKKKPAAK